MIAVGQTIEDVRGTRYRVEREFPPGGQGIAYAVTEEATGRAAVAKAYHPAVATAEAAARLDALIKLDLPSRSPALCGPTARLDPRHGLGAVMPRAEGTPLEELFESASFTLVDALGAAAALCRAITVLERIPAHHGDIARSNVVVRGRGRHHEVFLIDFDNAGLPGVAAPSFMGQDLYAAPELLAGRGKPTAAGDRFSLAVLLHEILLGRHPFASVTAAGMGFADYVALLQTTAWPEDPAGAAEDPGPGTVPTGVLPRSLHALFRRALQPDPARRPEAAAWARACEEALGQVFRCGRCGQHFVNEAARFACPCCGAAAEPFVLHVAGRMILLAGMSTVLGRDELAGPLTVSRRHAAFLRKGFALFVRNLSPNGLAVRTPAGWAELKEGQEADLSDGDTVRFAPGTEGTVRTAGR